MISKNYMAPGEIRELNRLTSVLLDIFEDQLELGRLVVMDDAMALLDRQLTGLGRAVLNGGGSVSATAARAHAGRIYADFDRRRREDRQLEGGDEIGRLVAEAKGMVKPRAR